MPSGLRFDVEFTAGVWTDVTSLVLASPSARTDFGRVSEFGSPQTATCRFTLNNTSGNFTARNAASSYYPNVVPGKRVRVSFSSGTLPRFIGYIKSWTPSLAGSMLPVVEVFATDRLDTIGDATLPQCHIGTTRGMGAAFHLPLADAITATTESQTYPLYEAISGNTVTFRQERPGGQSTLADGSISWGGPDLVPLEGTASIGFTHHTGAETISGAYGIAVDAYTATTAGVTVAFWTDDATFTSGGVDAAFIVYGNQEPQFPGGSGGSGTTVTPGLKLSPLNGALQAWIVDGTTWRTVTGVGPAGSVNHWCVTASITAGTVTLNIYCNGNLVATTSGALSTVSFTGLHLYQFSTTGAASHNTSHYSDLVGFSRALNGSEVATLYQSGTSGFSGELSGSRALRVLQYLGNLVNGTDLNLDAGAETMGTLYCSGVSLSSVLEGIATTEGGGAAFYVDVDGRIRYVDRQFRNTLTPVLTLDASVDLRPGDWSPTADSFAAINKSTVTRTGGGTATYTDGTTVPESETVTSLAATDDNILNLATWRVITSQARPRFPKLVVNIAASSSAASLYTALANIEIGSLIRINNFPKLLTRPGGGTTRIFYTSQFDAYVEGWSEEVGPNSYTVTFDLSPAPPRLLLDNATVGRLTGTTQTLTSTITAGATSMSLTTSAGPVLTTSAGDYPLFLQIDEEIVSVTAVPGGTSPQTLTISRGQLGTFADAHTAGAAVTVYAGSLTL